MASWGKGERGERKMIPFLFFLGDCGVSFVPRSSTYGYWFYLRLSKFPKRIISPLDLLGKEAHCDGERDYVDGQEAEDGQDVAKVPPLREKNRVKFLFYKV